MKNLGALLLATCTLLSTVAARADNPLFLDQFSADPTARNFNGKIYLFNSHDILPPNGGRGGFFMADYHVHSSTDLIDWTDHGVIVDQKDVPWAMQNYGMWAPDCVFKNGKYYFYFPTNSRPVTDATAPATPTTPTTAPATATTGRAGRGRGQGGGGVKRVGAAVADKPEGPYTIEPTYIPNIPASIDPSILIDPKDGAAYLIYALNNFYIARLKDNMLEMAEPPKLMAKFPDTRSQGLIEGPFAFERKGVYYIAYPHDVGGGEQLEYATADSPEGQYTYRGVIMDKSKSGCWTNQCSLVEYQGQWILFYHDKDLSPNDGNRRSVRADYVTFNDDGSINKVTPTLRGVGICDARRHIQIDRYSAVSATGTAVSFLDNDNKTAGWKIALTEKNAFVRYDRVDFGKTPLKSVRVRATSSTGATLEIRLDTPAGPLAAKVALPKGATWNETTATLASPPAGLHNLVVTLPEQNNAEIDWVSFE